MPELLFIQPSEISNTTILGGNVDVDKYLFCILNTQVSVIEPLLGSELYDYIVGNFQSLNGDYLTLMDEYIKPITKNEAIAQYIEMASYTLNNGGLFKHSPSDAEIVDKSEAEFLAGKYHSLSQMYILRFNKWICNNKIPQYKLHQDGVNASKSMKTTSGWYFKNKGISADQYANKFK